MAKLEEVRFLDKDLEHALGMSAIVNHNGTLYLSGIIAVDDDQRPLALNDFEGQLNFVYDRLCYALGKLHVGLENVLNETIFVTDMKKLKEAAPLRASRYQPGCAPAVTAVQVAELFYPECMIELQVIARAPEYTGIRQR